MSSMSRNKRLIENEVIFRDVNKNIQEFVKEETDALSSETIPFYCECSNPDCAERIKLTPKQYEDLHRDRKYFVIVIGHEFPEVEKVISKNNGYQVVEKHFTPPKAEDINLALKTINSTASSA